MIQQMADILRGIAKKRTACLLPRALSFSPSPLLPHVRSLVLPLAVALLLALAGCANPVPPGGGPRDTTPPAVVRSDPASGTVNVTQDHVTIAFSEYVDRQSFEQALSATPLFEQDFDIDWDGREVVVGFPEPLRENTTYILSLSTDLSDVRGVQLNEPITIAFATGPTINKGQLSGNVVAADDGSARAGMNIYAYALTDSAAAPPDSLPPRPAYRTQSGSDGQFQFEYLREQPYYVIALQDDNRNFQPDPLEAFAVPPRPALMADSTGTAVAPPWIVTRPDTLPPTPVRLRSLSAARYELRFDEPVRLRDRTPARWTLRDSVQNTAATVQTVYQRAATPALVYLRTEPLRPAPHRLSVPAGAVVDSSGNPVQAATLRFTPIEASDTLGARFLTFLPDKLIDDTLAVRRLLPDEAPAARFNQPLDSTRLRAVLAARDSAAAPRPFTLTTDDGTTYRFRFAPPLRPGDDVQLRVDGRRLAGPDSVFTQRYRRIRSDLLGAVGGTVAFTDTTLADSTRADSLRPDAPIVVELYATDQPARYTPRSTRAGPDGAFLFRQLPEGSYRFRAFLDPNANGRWDGGLLVPYRPAEPLAWSGGTINNRPRWENVMEEPLRLPIAPRP